jgi:Flp pilus assembly pilin Flp
MSKAVTQRSLHQVWRCSKGVTAIEYALIAGTVAAVLIFSVATVSKHLDNSLRQTSTELSGMPGTGGGSSPSPDDSSPSPDDSSPSPDDSSPSNDDDDGGGNSGKGKGKKGR